MRRVINILTLIALLPFIVVFLGVSYLVVLAAEIFERVDAWFHSQTEVGQ